MLTDPYRVLAVVLSTLAAGIACILMVWDPTETSSARVMLPSWMGPIPTWAGVPSIMFVAAGLVGLWSNSAARNHVAAVIWTALAGGLPMVTMATSEPTCNPTGSIATGLMTAAVFAGAGWVYGSNPGNASGPSTNFGNFSLIFFLRGSAAGYFVILATVTVAAETTGVIDVDLLGAILVFCGIGVTAAGMLSAKRGSRNIISLSGVAISLLGAGIEMDLAFRKQTVEYETWHFLFVAGLLSMTVIFPMALQTGWSVVRQAGLILAALVAGAFTFTLAQIHRGSGD